MSRSNPQPLVRVDSAAHWYLPNGQSYHTVLDAKGEPRKTTLRDARKCNAYPSVTTIQKVMANPFLESWKVEQAIHSALTLPRLEGESLDDFAVRIVDDSREQARKAAEFGGQIHSSIEQFNLTFQMPAVEDPLYPYVKHYADWFETNVEAVLNAEETVVHPIGYAGKCDLRAKIKDRGICVIDFKTQNVKTKELKKAGVIPDPKFYDRFYDQLVAYGDAFLEDDKPVEGHISLVINSNEPMPVFEKHWPKEDYSKARRRFRACFELWCCDNDYHPGMK